jgi:hypothetical protein
MAKRKALLTREMMAMELGIPIEKVHRLVAKLGIKPVETVPQKGWNWRRHYYAPGTTEILRAALSAKTIR